MRAREADRTVKEETIVTSAIRRMLPFVFAAAIVLLPAAEAHVRGRWVKMAPFPDADEELYGIAANGKMYVLGGFAGGRLGRVYEYDPAT